MHYRYRDINLLVEAGYDVVQKSPWHFQIMDKVIINIWPTKQKYMKEWGDGAKFYSDVVAAVKEMLDPEISHVEQVQKQFEVIMAPLEDALCEWRSDLDEYWWAPLYEQAVL